MLPEEKARIRIDKQLENAGWNIAAREEYVPGEASAVKELLMQGNTESDYALFVDDKAIAIIEAKRAENPLEEDVRGQAEGYATHPLDWYGLWFPGLIPLVYVANGERIYFRNLLQPDSDYVELSRFHSPKEMLLLIRQSSVFGALPRLEKRGLRDCQYNAEVALEKTLKAGKKKSLAILATGAGKTYFACLASYRWLNYTNVGVTGQGKRILFLADRNNLARQAESEFSTFDRTEGRTPMSSLYDIRRLTREENIRADIVISTVQKLFAVLTGNDIIGTGNEDEEDERNTAEEEKDTGPAVQLGDHLTLPPDYFQMIIVDECHRSIYGKWRAVLDYFSSAHILGLTATPTPEAIAFFDKNTIEEYTYEQSVVEGVNVPYRVYRIKTTVTEHGGTIHGGSKVTETPRGVGGTRQYKVPQSIAYDEKTLDRSVINPQQIEKVLTAYKDAIYTDLYPGREKKWEYVPKTLIFAKSEDHATEIVEAVKHVFGPEFESGEVPENFVQKITYTAEDSNGLIRDLRNEKEFRISVTVTLVATGTDVRPLEVVLFMKDVHSEVLYTQMKGRGCRTVDDDRLREVTPNADTKECYYIVDAVGVTESSKVIPRPIYEPGRKIFSMEELIERLAHGEVSDDNLLLLSDRCAGIQRRYETNALFEHHLDQFIASFGFAPQKIAADIQAAYAAETLPPYISISDPNTVRKALIEPLIASLPARRKLIQMYHGYTVRVEDDPDHLLYAGFSKETARSFIENLEKYLNDNRDSVEALRILYNNDDTPVTYGMLLDLRDRLLAENRQYSAWQIWKNYRLLDETGDVDELDMKQNVNALTHLIQIVRYAYRRSRRLTSLLPGYTRRFTLYCGQVQRALTDGQRAVMQRIAEYVINDGAISAMELNDIDTDLWRSGVVALGGVPRLEEEMQAMAGILLKAS